MCNAEFIPHRPIIKFRIAEVSIPLMYPFECTRCRKRHYAQSKRMVQCCEDAPVQPLVSICLLIPTKLEPTFKVVHTTPLQTPLPGPNGQKWATACNSSIKPQVTTTYGPACTCYKCKAWWDEQLRKAEEPEQKKEEQVPVDLKGVDFVDEDNPENSFSFPPPEKILTGKSSIRPKTPDEIIEEYHNLQKTEKLTKIVQTRKTLAQELRFK